MRIKMSTKLIPANVLMSIAELLAKTAVYLADKLAGVKVHGTWEW